MFYQKFSQRYLAIIVACFILTLGFLGASFLIYLFNEGCSPLVLTFEHNASEVKRNSAELDDKTYKKQSKISYNVEGGLDEENAASNVDLRFARISATQQNVRDENNSVMNVDTINDFAVTLSIDSVEDDLIGETTQRESQIDRSEREHFDTIYIDDFERTNNVRATTIVTPVRAEEESTAKVAINTVKVHKINRMHEKKRKSNHKNENEPTKAQKRNEEQMPLESNPDILYDSYIFVDDDDNDDSFGGFGSGSGDYENNIISAQLKEPHIDAISVIKNNFKMLPRDGKKKKQNKIQKLRKNNGGSNSTRQSKRLKKGDKQQDYVELNDNTNANATRDANAIGTQNHAGNNSNNTLNKLTNSLLDLSKRFAYHSDEKQSSNRSKISLKNLSTDLRTPLTTAITTGVEKAGNAIKQLKNNKNKKENIRHTMLLENNSLSGQAAQHQLVPKHHVVASLKYNESKDSKELSNDPVNANSAAWLETRTRRIIGNVKKSEERSRQLLLCEEAGGGELCRMLFKGYVNE